MSQWTHISGMIRIDSVEVALGKYLPSEFGTVINNILPPNVPTGSEGPMKVLITQYPKTPEYEGKLQWGFVAVWGDLRDFGDDEKRDIGQIHEWLNRVVQKCKKYAISIRTLAVSAEVEYGPTYFFSYDGEGDEVDTYTIIRRNDDKN